MGRIFGRKRQTQRGGKAVETGSKASTSSSRQSSEFLMPQQQTVHRRNVHLFAQPVILAFSVVRFIAFQLWILLSFACRLSSRALQHEDAQSGRDVVDVVQADPSTPVGSTLRGLQSGTSVRLQGGRPAEPVLAQQKHHHRKAFEYISKALKLDEEDKG